jgi:hypothetical protein
VAYKPMIQSIFYLFHFSFISFIFLLSAKKHKKNLYKNRNDARQLFYQSELACCKQKMKERRKNNERKQKKEKKKEKGL